MSANLSFLGRAQLAGYAGLAGSVFTGRSKRIAVVVVVDVFAVALAFGALQVTGAMMGGAHKQQAPVLIAPVEAAEVSAIAAAVAPAVVVPAPHLAPRMQVALAATADAAILFALPVGETTAFTAASTFSGGSSNSFTPSPEVIASNPPPSSEPPVVTPDDPVVTAPLPATFASVVKHRAAKTVKHIDQTVDTAIDLADDSLDKLLLRDIPSAAAGLSSMVNQTVGSVLTAAVQSKSAGTNASSGGLSADTSVSTTVAANATPVASTVNQVTQSVGQTVSKVTSILN